MRPEHLVGEESLAAFLCAFEARTLPKAEWTHGAHVAAAASYLQQAAHGGDYGAAYEAVLPLMRERICAFNLAVGGANTATSGYHETLTRFWLLSVARLLEPHQPHSPLEASRLAVAQFGEQRALHTLYYSGDLVKDSAARRGWREPDLRPLPRPGDS